MTATHSRKGLHVTCVVAVCTVALLLAAIPASAKITLTDKVGDKELKLNIYGFSQFEMRGGDGASSEGGVFSALMRSPEASGRSREPSPACVSLRRSR